MPDKPLKLGVLASGSGRTLQNFLDLQAAGQLAVQVAVVIGSRQGIGALQRAANARVMNFVVDARAFANPQAQSKQIFSLMDDAGVDLVCLAGWLNLLVVPPPYATRVMNIHPALLPSFGGKGMYGDRVHQAVLDAGCKISGCTVHFVNAEYDSGPIIMQRTCPVLEGDDAHTLAARVFEEERIAYPQAIRLFGQGRLRIDKGRVIVDEPVEKW